MTNKGTQLTQEELIANLTSKGKGVKFGDASKFNVSLDEIEDLNSQASMLEAVGSIASYNKMLDERITLINESLTAAIPFTRENLYLFCALSGSGKSTVAANISFPLWKQQKRTLVISNEESRQDVWFRIACIELGYNFNDYKKGNMPLELQTEVIRLFPEIKKYVTVIDVNYKNGLTTKIEGIKSALESVKEQDYSCVMIDYFQLVQASVADPSRTRYDVLNELRMWLGRYIKSSNMPVVLFVQLYSSGKKGGTTDLEARIKECSAVIEPATVIIEVIADFTTKTTQFCIFKDRFGLQGHRIECGYDNGRFVKISKSELIQRQAEAKRAKAGEELDLLIGDIGDKDDSKG